MMTVWESKRYQGIFARCLGFCKRIGMPVPKKICPTLMQSDSPNIWGFTYVLPYTNRYNIGITTRLYDDYAVKGKLSTKREDALCSVIFHEIIHTLPGCWNHGKEWKRWARFLNSRGCRVDLNPYGKNPPPWER